MIEMIGSIYKNIYDETKIISEGSERQKREAERKRKGGKDKEKVQQKEEGIPTNYLDKDPFPAPQPSLSSHQGRTFAPHSTHLAKLKRRIPRARGRTDSSSSLTRRAAVAGSTARNPRLALLLLSFSQCGT